MSRLCVCQIVLVFLCPLVAKNCEKTAKSKEGLFFSLDLKAENNGRTSQSKPHQTVLDHVHCR